MAEPAEFILNALIALLGGTLIGLERERAQIAGSEAKTGSIPGMRSFGVLAVYGAVVAYAAGAADSLLVAASLAAFTLLLGFHAYTRMVKQGVLGVTTYIVMLATFFMGVLAGLGLRIESAALSVIITLVLALKRPAERLAKALRYDELLAMLEVAAIALVLGPIIRAYSQAYGADIIFKVYAFFTIVLLLSLASYAAARLWGARGILYAAALGSLVNSEATISSVTSIVGELADPEVRRRLLRLLIPTIIAVLQVRASMLMVLAAYIFTGTIPAEVAYAASLIARPRNTSTDNFQVPGRPQGFTLNTEPPLLVGRPQERRRIPSPNPGIRDGALDRGRRPSGDTPSLPRRPRERDRHDTLAGHHAQRDGHVHGRRGHGDRDSRRHDKQDTLR